MIIIKPILLLLYFVVLWLPSVIIYTCLFPLYLILKILCKVPMRPNAPYWANLSFLIFLICLFSAIIVEFEGAGLFLIWAFIGSFIIDIAAKTPAPYGKLKTYYRKLYPIKVKTPKPIINKVKVISKSTEDESLKRIKSRLSPHLQELISK